MLHTADIVEALTALGKLLEERQLRFDGIVLGGANLLVSEIIDRPTIDVDVVAQRGEGGELLPATPLPEDVAEAADIIAQLRGLPSDWFNSMAGSEIAFGLPSGCLTRLRRQAFGGLTIWWVDRRDMVAFKLVAAVDHLEYPVNKHLEDLHALQPTADELAHGVGWFEQITSPTSAAFSGLRTVLQEFDDAP